MQKHPCIRRYHSLDPGILHFGFLVACGALASVGALMSIEPYVIHRSHFKKLYRVD